MSSTPAATYARPHYAGGVAATIPTPTGDLGQVLEGAAKWYPERVAIDFLGETTTYAEMTAQVAKAAEVLRRAGVGHGDVVAVCLPNCPQHAVVFYAITRLGAIVAEHNPLAPAAQLRAQLAAHGARVVIAWENAADALAGHDDSLTLFTVNLAAALPWSKQLGLKLPVAKARKLRRKMRSRVPAHARSWEQELARATGLAPSHPRPAVQDVAVLLHTGGTTGTPKAVMLTHYNLLANVSQACQWVPHLHEGAEVFLTVLPFFHAFGLTFNLLCAVNFASTQLMFPTFDLGLILPAFARRTPTFCVAVPVVFERLLQAAHKAGVDLTSIHTAISGAMALPTELAQEWEKATGGIIVAGYGMTETSPIVAGSPLTEERRPEALGLPFAATDVRVVDPQGNDVPPGEPGELLIRGPQVCKGYWKNPTATAELIDADGWLHTGDIVRDEDGFLVMADRARDLILVGGFNVYPTAVEAVLSRAPGVQEVAVVGVQSGGNEVVVAVVVPKEGHSVSLRALQDFGANELPRYSLPHRLELTDSIPRNEIGKVLRRQVREFLAQLPSKK
ncbi:MAG: AMP-binding protein [Buchananella hordeovulneris]|nr:AMP-binding protein [Buchananella hordeovulneris]